MMRMRRRWRWLVIGAGLAALAWFVLARLQDRWARAELQRAVGEISVGRVEAARARLTALAARPGAAGGGADYWLGICESLAGHPEAALRAFARVPEVYAFDPVGAYHEAKANLSSGRLRAAESRLEQALARGGGGPLRERLREMLRRVYELEFRFDDIRALFHAVLAEEADPTRALKELSNLDLERLPRDGLKAAIEKAGQLAPEDDRVWLGRARLAIEDGRWDEAAAWLARCREAGADAPVWRAWLDWARGSNRPDEVVEAARRLGAEALDPAERFELRAWLERRRGDDRAEASELGRWLQIEPMATRALERLAELSHREGRPDQAAEFRRRKAEVERAMDAYRLRLWREEPLRTSADRAGLARLAESAGRPREARALYAWACRVDPADRPAREGLARVERSEAARAAARAAEPGPWPEPPPSATASHPTGPAGGIAFTDDAEAAGLRFVYDNAETPIHQLPEPFGGGLALLDYDGDGWLDVYCVQGGPFAPAADRDSPSLPAPGAGDRLFRNRGDGTFEDVTDRSGIGRFPRGHGHGVTVGDVDGDGRPDLFVTRWRSYALYRNRGDGTFEDATGAWGLGGRRDWPTSSALADLDGDGDLDLYVCHYAVWDLDNPRICRDRTTQAYLNCNPLDAEALPDRLFRNDGGRFTDVSETAGIRAADRNGRGLGVVAADLDADGRIDLFVANDSSANFLFRNLGGMRFEEVGHDAGVAGNASGGYQAGMGVAAGDLDGDGLIDLAVTNFYGESTTFFRNLGGGAFIDATATVGLAVATRHRLGFGLAFLDANNDGRLDLASANGHVNDLRPNYPYRMPAQLLVAGPDGRLADVSETAGAPWQVPRMGRGLVVGDLDNDGRQDVLILSHNQPLAYLHNRTEGGRSLTLRLEGRGSNRDADGARVAVAVGGHRLVAWRIGGGSFQSSSDPRLHFGLGGVDRADSVEVIWPSGRRDRHEGLEAGAGYLLREGRAEPEPLAGFSSTGRSRRSGEAGPPGVIRPPLPSR